MIDLFLIEDTLNSLVVPSFDNVVVIGVVYLMVVFSGGEEGKESSQLLVLSKVDAGTIEIE